MYLWDWFFDACSIRRDHDKPITADQWKAWQEMIGAIIRPNEWRALREMDQAYVGETLKEKADALERIKEASANGRHSRTGI